MNLSTKFNNSLVNAINTFKEKCEKLDYKVFDRNNSEQKFLTIDNDTKNLFEVFTEPRSFAEDIQVQLIGHGFGEEYDLFNLKFEPTTKKLTFVIRNVSTIGTIQILPEWKVETEHDSEDYYYNYDDNNKKTSQYLATFGNMIITINF